MKPLANITIMHNKHMYSIHTDTSPECQQGFNTPSVKRVACVRCIQRRLAEANVSTLVPPVDYLTYMGTLSDKNS